MPNGDKKMKRTPRFTISTALNIQISDHLFIGRAKPSEPHFSYASHMNRTKKHK